MLSNRRRLIVLLAGVIALLLVATVVYLLLPPRQTRSVALPADDATPEQVVRAYLDALDAHDCARAESLVTDPSVSWCDGDLESVSPFEISPATQEKPQYSGRSRDEEVVNVQVSFDLQHRPLRGDISMPNGPTSWGYLLTRDSSETPWRIYDQGMG